MHVATMLAMLAADPPATMLAVRVANFTPCERPHFSCLETATVAVPKLGWISSNNSGEVLRFGPIWPKARGRCAVLRATLGYLASWRPTQGQFDIICEGCSCSSIRGFWSRQIYPFPQASGD